MHVANRNIGWLGGGIAAGEPVDIEVLAAEIGRQAYDGRI